MSVTTITPGRTRPRPPQRPIRPARPITIVERTTAYGALVAGALFALLLGALHVVRPDLDPTWRFVSEYALGRSGWLMTGAFTCLALSLVGCVVWTFRHTRTVLGRLGLLIVTIAAAGLLLAAGFETDPITAGPDQVTTAGQLHVLGASLDYSPIGMLLAGWGLSRTVRDRALRRPLMITAVVAVLLMIGFSASLPHDGQFGPGVLSGMIGRFLLLSYLGWIFVACRVVLRAPVGRG